ncbi:MAG: putative peroxidase-related enzyme [Planctomycetota bacterium]
MRALKSSHKDAELTPADRALLDYAVKLTLRPAEVNEADVQRLRTVGFDDRAITDAAHNIAFFGYINRMAQGLGVELESFMQAGGERIAPDETLPQE